MKLAIFDDTPLHFYPVSLTRSVGDIRCGILKLRQRLQALLFGEEEIVFVEKELVSLYQERHPDWQINSAEGDTLFVNSRIKVNPDVIKKIKNIKVGQGLTDDKNALIALRMNVTKTITSLNQIDELMKQAETDTVKSVLYSNMADVIMDNSRLIEFDFEQFFQDAENFMETEPGVTLLNPYKVWIGEGAILKPGVVIDASHGAVVIDEKAEIMSHAVIIGPAYIGKNSVIKVGSKIYGGTSIGPVCKVGGEVEGSIIQAYSNKQHDGFLGHAYIGEWVNLGAGTNNSDLKNNYKSVSFYTYTDKTKIDSGYQFLGSIIADHTKTGISCTLNTGIVAGAGCNLWGTDLFTDFIPSFSWGEAGKLVPYDFDAFVHTTEAVKKRRNQNLSKTEIELFRNIKNREN